MKNQFKVCSLFCALIVLGIVSAPAYSAITFGAAKKTQPKMVQTSKYLDGANPALRRALNIHNLLNEMKGMKDVLHTGKDLKEQEDVFLEFQEIISECNSKKLEGVFKNPKETWAKMNDAYEKKRLSLGNEGDPIAKGTEERIESSKNYKSISRDIMLDVYENPEKWGKTKDGSSFPLWQDQAIVFEEEWNNFYKEMNKAFGVPLAGRPDVDEAVRQNPKKYDDVLRAHKSYLASLQQKKNLTYDLLPPKAPTPLPDWKEIVVFDSDANQPHSELPDVWKDSKNRQILKKNPKGELSQAFSNGNIETPTDLALVSYRSTLEQEFELRMMQDAIQKSSFSYKETMEDIKKNFNDKLSKLSIAIGDSDLANTKGYFEIQKLLREEKAKAITDAEKYIEILEKQDAEHPELVQKRRQAQERKLKRLSEDAREIIEQTNAPIVQISQMSPVTQQKIVVDALKKDKEALVHLTETNAMELDQLMRERQATDKIIAESQKQMKSAYANQIKNLPDIKEANCSF